MRIIKLHATESTNSFLKGFVKQSHYTEEVALIANKQTAGRGQMGNTWLSEEDKSLTVSMFKKINTIDIAQQFYLSMHIALSLKKVMESYRVPDVFVKWPNDIMSGNLKIGGILIENCIVGKKWIGSIIGIGLNANNETFVGLPKASSIKLLTDNEVSIEALSEKVISQINNDFLSFTPQNFSSLKKAYETALFKRAVVSHFKDLKTQQKFNGIIKGVNNLGLLEVETESNQIRHFNLKEVKLYF